jgi:hypothetical protein
MWETHGVYFVVLLDYLCFDVGMHKGSFRLFAGQLPEAFAFLGGQRREAFKLRSHGLVEPVDVFAGLLQRRGVPLSGFPAFAHGAFVRYRLNRIAAAMASRGVS